MSDLQQPLLHFESGKLVKWEEVDPTSGQLGWQLGNVVQVPSDRSAEFLRGWSPGIYGDRQPVIHYAGQPATLVLRAFHGGLSLIQTDLLQDIPDRNEWDKP